MLPRAPGAPIWGKNREDVAVLHGLFLVLSSLAELSVKKPGHKSKPPGRRFGREGALSLGANQHECVYA